MANIAVGDVIQVTFRQKLFNQRLLNTFHYQARIVTGTINYESAIVGLDGAISGPGGLLDAFLACTQQDVALEEIWYQRVHPTRLYLQKKVKNLTGDRLSASNATNLAAHIGRRTETATRRSTGGIHVPVAADAVSTVGGNITAGLKGSMVLLAAEMLTGYATNAGAISWVPVLFGPFRPAKGDKPALPAKVEDLIATEVFETTRVMRRRTVGVGE